MLLSFFFFFLKFLGEREKERKNETLSLSCFSQTLSLLSLSDSRLAAQALSKLTWKESKLQENLCQLFTSRTPRDRTPGRSCFRDVFFVFFSRLSFSFSATTATKTLTPLSLSPPCSHPPNTSVDVVIPRSAMYTAKAFGLEILSLAAKKSTNRSKAGAMARARENRSGRTKFCAIQNAE